MKDEVKIMFRDMMKKIKTYGVRSGRDVTKELRALCDRIDQFEMERELSFKTDDVDSSFVGELRKQIRETYAGNGRGKLRERDREIMTKIAEHLMFGFHPLTHCTDLISLADLCTTLSSVYPDDEFFAPAANYFNTDKVTRKLGPLISRSNSPLFNKMSCYYIPVDPLIPGDKPSNGKQSIWVLRAGHKYVNLGPADLHREYWRQYNETAVQIHHKMPSGWESKPLDLVDSDFTWCKHSKTYERISAQNVAKIRHARLEQEPSFM